MAKYVAHEERYEWWAAGGQRTLGSELGRDGRRPRGPGSDPTAASNEDSFLAALAVSAPGAVCHNNKKKGSFKRNRDHLPQ